MSQATKLNPVSAVQKAYDFMLWMFPHIAKYPREHKFALGDSIRTSTLGVLELLIQAQYSRDKLSSLERANRRIEVLRYLLRASHDLKCLSPSQYEHGIKLLHTAGAEVGGWTKQQQTRGRPRA